MKSPETKDKIQKTKNITPIDWDAHAKAMAWADGEVRALADQWTALTGSPRLKRITGWSFVPALDGDQRDVIITGVHGRMSKEVELRFPEIWLTASRGLRTTWMIRRYAEEIRTGQDAVTADANARIAELHQQIALAQDRITNIEKSMRPPVQRITLELIEEQRQAQVLSPDRVLSLNPVSGGFRTNALLLAEAIAKGKRVDAEIRVPKYGTLVPVRITPKEAIEVADLYFASIGVRDRESYLARTAHLKAELREAAPAIRKARAAIRERMRAGDTAQLEIRELEAQRSRFRLAHDERRLARAWAGSVIARRRAAEAAPANTQEAVTA